MRKNYWVCNLPLKIDLPDVDGERDAGSPPVLRDLLRHEGQVHRAQPLVVQGGAAPAAAHTDHEAGLVYHEVGRHLCRLVKTLSSDFWLEVWTWTFKGRW